MHSVAFIVGFGAIIGIIVTEKVSPRPGLKSFRDDYNSVAKTCVAVGYVKDNCKSNRDRKNMIVAFDAKGKRSTQIVSQGNTVIFGDVLLTKGGGYNAVTGIFVAPKSGVYIFFWTIVTNTNKNAHTSLVLNGKRRADNLCHNNSHGVHMSCSEQAVIIMTAGDKVSIESFAGTSTLYSSFCSFSGFML